MKKGYEFQKKSIVKDIYIRNSKLTLDRNKFSRLFFRF